VSALSTFYLLILKNIMSQARADEQRVEVTGEREHIRMAAEMFIGSKLQDTPCAVMVPRAWAESLMDLPDSDPMQVHTVMHTNLWNGAAPLRVEPSSSSSLTNKDVPALGKDPSQWFTLPLQAQLTRLRNALLELLLNCMDILRVNVDKGQHRVEIEILDATGTSIFDADSTGVPHMIRTLNNAPGIPLVSTMLEDTEILQPTAAAFHLRGSSNTREKHTRTAKVTAGTNGFGMKTCFIMGAHGAMWTYDATRGKVFHQSCGNEMKTLSDASVWDVSNASDAKAYKKTWSSRSTSSSSSLYHNWPRFPTLKACTTGKWKNGWTGVDWVPDWDILLPPDMPESHPAVRATLVTTVLQTAFVQCAAQPFVKWSLCGMELPSGKQATTCLHVQHARIAPPIYTSTTIVKHEDDDDIIMEDAASSPLKTSPWSFSTLPMRTWEWSKFGPLGLMLSAAGCKYFDLEPIPLARAKVDKSLTPTWTQGEKVGLQVWLMEATPASGSATTASSSSDTATQASIASSERGGGGGGDEDDDDDAKQVMSVPESLTSSVSQSVWGCQAWVNGTPVMVSSIDSILTELATYMVAGMQGLTLRQFKESIKRNRKADASELARIAQLNGRISHVKHMLSVTRCTVSLTCVNPSFNNQTKDELTSTPGRIGARFMGMPVPKTAWKQLKGTLPFVSSQVERDTSILASKQLEDASKKILASYEGMLVNGVRKVKHPQLQDAMDASLDPGKVPMRVLILAEGDSALAFPGNSLPAPGSSMASLYRSNTADMIEASQSTRASSKNVGGRGGIVDVQRIMIQRAARMCGCPDDVLSLLTQQPQFPHMGEMSVLALVARRDDVTSFEIRQGWRSLIASLSAPLEDDVQRGGGGDGKKTSKKKKRGKKASVKQPVVGSKRKRGGALDAFVTTTKDGRAKPSALQKEDNVTFTDVSEAWDMEAWQARAPVGVAGSVWKRGMSWTDVQALIRDDVEAKRMSVEEADVHASMWMKVLWAGVQTTSVGLLSLKGNTLTPGRHRGNKIKDVLKNGAWTAIMAAMGWSIHTPELEFKRYEMIMIMTDGDVDGSRIASNVVSGLAELFPAMQQRMYSVSVLRTPVLFLNQSRQMFTTVHFDMYLDALAEGKTELLHVDGDVEAVQPLKGGSGHDAVRYVKGLGSYTATECPLIMAGGAYIQLLNAWGALLETKQQAWERVLDFGRRDPQGNRDMLSDMDVRTMVKYEKTLLAGLGQDVMVDAEGVPAQRAWVKRALPDWTGWKPSQLAVLAVPLWKMSRKEATQTRKLNTWKNMIAHLSDSEHGEASVPHGDMGAYSQTPVGMFVQEGQWVTLKAEAADGRYIFSKLATFPVAWPPSVPSEDDDEFVLWARDVTRRIPGWTLETLATGAWCDVMWPPEDRDVFVMDKDTGLPLEMAATMCVSLCKGWFGMAPGWRTTMFPSHPLRVLDAHLMWARVVESWGWERVQRVAKDMWNVTPHDPTANGRAPDALRVPHDLTEAQREAWDVYVTACGRLEPWWHMSSSRVVRLGPHEWEVMGYVHVGPTKWTNHKMRVKGVDTVRAYTTLTVLDIPRVKSGFIPSYVAKISQLPCVSDVDFSNSDAMSTFVTIQIDTAVWWNMMGGCLDMDKLLILLDLKHTASLKKVFVRGRFGFQIHTCEGAAGFIHAWHLRRTHLLMHRDREKQEMIKEKGARAMEQAKYLQGLLDAPVPGAPAEVAAVKPKSIPMGTKVGQEAQVRAMAKAGLRTAREMKRPQTRARRYMPRDPPPVPGEELQITSYPHIRHFSPYDLTTQRAQKCMEAAAHAAGELERYKQFSPIQWWMMELARAACGVAEYMEMVRATLNFKRWKTGEERLEFAIQKMTREFRKEAVPGAAALRRGPRTSGAVWWSPNKHWAEQMTALEKLWKDSNMKTSAKKKAAAAAAVTMDQQEENPHDRAKYSIHTVKRALQSMQGLLMDKDTHKKKTKWKDADRKKAETTMPVLWWLSRPVQWVGEEEEDA
jgi:DNA gyrase/topoisomerase IV subunit B